jgi:hypothetical protein
MFPAAGRADFMIAGRNGHKSTGTARDHETRSRQTERHWAKTGSSGLLNFFSLIHHTSHFYLLINCLIQFYRL